VSNTISFLSAGKYFKPQKKQKDLTKGAEKFWQTGGKWKNETICVAGAIRG